MFDIGWSEMAVILLVALVVIGPRDLPRVARTMGKWVAKGRAMAREFQSAIEDMAREAELDKVKSEIEKAGRTDFGKTIENTIDPTGELGKAFDPTARSGAKGAANPGTPGAARGHAAEARPASRRRSRPRPPSRSRAAGGRGQACRRPADPADLTPDAPEPAGLKPADPKPLIQAGNGKAAA